MKLKCTCQSSLINRNQDNISQKTEVWTVIDSHVILAEPEGPTRTYIKVRS